MADNLDVNAFIKAQQAQAKQEMIDHLKLIAQRAEQLQGEMARYVEAVTTANGADALLCYNWGLNEVHNFDRNLELGQAVSRATRYQQWMNPRPEDFA